MKNAGEKLKRNKIRIGLPVIGLLLTASSYVNPKARAELLEAPIEVPEELAEVVPDRIEQCIQNLLAEIGKPDTMGTTSLPSLYRKGSVEQDEEFLEHLFSIIYVESGFNRKAISPMEAYGLMQMTRIAVTDAVLHCNLRPIVDMAKLHDSVTNVKYGSCFLKKMLDEVDGDWTRALILYNGGYQQLTKYNKGESIASETANYSLKVNRVLKEICRKPKQESTK